MTITHVTPSAYTIPTDRPEADGTLSWDETDLVLVEVGDGDHVGIGWTYAGTGAVRVIEDHLATVVVGSEGAALPSRLRRRLGRSETWVGPESSPRHLGCRHRPWGSQGPQPGHGLDRPVRAGPQRSAHLRQRRIHHV